MPLELEIKLLADAAALRAVGDLPAVAQHNLYPPVTRRLRSVYFDTPDLALRRNGIGLRLRRNGRRSLQTVKTEGASSAGLHQRNEWETPVAHGAFDFRPIDDTRVRNALLQAEKTLRPIFATDFRRTQRMLKLGSDEIELCIDKGAIRAGDARAPIGEIEIELKTGSPTRLIELAHALVANLNVGLEARSKAERGYTLLSNAVAGARKATPIEIAKDASAASAFVAIVRDTLTHLQVNASGALVSDDPEYVHQARVALRRLRSACTLFRPLLDAQSTAGVVNDLRWLANSMNDVRNWDVFMGDTLPPMMQAGHGINGTRRLCHRAQAQQRAARQHARTTLASRRYQALLLNASAWTVHADWADASMRAVLEHPAIDYARSVLARRHRRLRKQGKHLATLGTEQRHELRIAAKKLRYAAEFFAALFPKHRVQQYISALAKLQDVLGTLNDAATTESLLDMLLVERVDTSDGAPLLREASSFVRGWVRGQAALSEPVLRSAWKKFKRAEVFW